MERIPTKQLDRVINRFGANCVAFVGSMRRQYSFRAFVSEYTRRDSRLARSRFETMVSTLGLLRPRDKVMYAPYHEFWESETEIRILYKGKTYTVAYDSTTCVGATPAYVWAILRPVSNAKSDYDDYSEGENNDV